MRRETDFLTKGFTDSQLLGGWETENSEDAKTRDETWPRVALRNYVSIFDKRHAVLAWGFDWCNAPYHYDLGRTVFRT